MAAIAACVGGSKARLYSYFQSKEQLLRTVLDRDVNEEAGRLMQELPSERDLRSRLVRLGIAYLTGHPRQRARARRGVAIIEDRSPVSRRSEADRRGRAPSAGFLSATFGGALLE